MGAAGRLPGLGSHREVLSQQLLGQQVGARLAVDERQVEGGLAPQVVGGACVAREGERRHWQVWVGRAKSGAAGRKPKCASASPSPGPRPGSPPAPAATAGGAASSTRS